MSKKHKNKVSLDGFDYTISEMSFHPRTGTMSDVYDLRLYSKTLASFTYREVRQLHRVFSELITEVEQRKGANYEQ